MNKNAILILGGVILALVVVAVVRGGNRELPVVSTDTVQARDIVERVSARECRRRCGVCLGVVPGHESC